MGTVTAARRFAAARRDSTIARLGTLLAYPTVSADPRRAGDMKECAFWLARLLRRIGLSEVAVHQGRVAPVVTAAWRGRADRPTLLVYGHYDVQPAGPASAWGTDPFRATQVGTYLHGRGASDDKGQLMAHLAAIEAWLRTAAELPLNLRLVLDGEEEIGSPTLVAAAARNWAPLTADAVLVSDTWMLAPDHPVLITSLRGVIRARLEVFGPKRDLHAGTFGGAVPNPAEALARLVAGLHDNTGRVGVRGFYGQVRPITGSERAHLSGVGPSDALMLAPAGGAPGYGEPGFSAFERTTRRPAIIVTRLSTSGGRRTVVPAWAAADLNVRLVGDQEPRLIAKALGRHLAARMPPGVQGRLLIADHSPSYTLDVRAPIVRAVRSACRTVFGRDPAFLPSGGSIPFVSALAATHYVDVALLGFGLRTDRTHAPNERMYLPNLFQGTNACIALYQQVARELMASTSPPQHPAAA